MNNFAILLFISLAGIAILASLISMLFRRVEKLKRQLRDVEFKNLLLCEALGLDLSQINIKSELTKRLRICLDKGDTDQAKKLVKDNIIEIEELKAVLRVKPPI